ncbi:hypothetical protein ECIV_ORF37 [European chub iridovirus]|nr:hypothetical protein ECIV_ORF37 [European chub iridovirus]
MSYYKDYVNFKVSRRYKQFQDHKVFVINTHIECNFCNYSVLLKDEDFIGYPDEFDILGSINVKDKTKSVLDYEGADRTFMNKIHAHITTVCNMNRYHFSFDIHGNVNDSDVDFIQIYVSELNYDFEACNFSDIKSILKKYYKPEDNEFHLHGCIRTNDNTDSKLYGTIKCPGLFMTDYREGLENEITLPLLQCFCKQLRGRDMYDFVC